MVARTSIWLLLVLSHQLVSSQRLSTGPIAGIHIGAKIRLPDNYIFPESSSNIFYLKEKKSTNSWSGLHIGWHLQYDYKALMISFEPNYSIFRVHKLNTFYPINSQSVLSPIYDDISYAPITIRNQILYLPFAINIRLLKRNTTPLLEVGSQIAFELLNTENARLEDNENPLLLLKTTDNEMLGVIYRDLRYVEYFLGTGIQIKDLIISCRYVWQPHRDDILARVNYFNIQLKSTFDFYKFRKGRTIFYNEY